MHDISNVIRELTAAEVNAVARAGIYSNEMDVYVVARNGNTHPDPDL